MKGSQRLWTDSKSSKAVRDSMEHGKFARLNCDMRNWNRLCNMTLKKWIDSGKLAIDSQFENGRKAIFAKEERCLRLQGAQETGWNANGYSGKQDGRDSDYRDSEQEFYSDCKNTKLKAYSLWSLRKVESTELAENTKWTGANDKFGLGWLDLWEDHQISMKELHVLVRPYPLTGDIICPLDLASKVCEEIVDVDVPGHWTGIQGLLVKFQDFNSLAP
ncbi:hypothetical protein Tco_0455104 [Tanacetum coccineum]